MIAISKFKLYLPERAKLRQMKCRNYTSYISIYSHSARQSKSEHIKLDSESEIKAGSVVIYSPQLGRHLWITIAKS